MKFLVYLMFTMALFFAGCASNKVSSKPQDVFRIDGDVITDTRTNLMWSRDANIARKLLNFGKGLQLVQDLSIGGYHDWRLPMENELVGLKNSFEYMPYDSLNRLGFVNVSPDQEYMSADTNKYGVLCVSFRFGCREDAAHLKEGPKNGLKPYVGSVEIPVDHDSMLVWPVRDLR